MRPRTRAYFRRNAIRTAWHVAIPVALFLAVRLLWGWQTDRRYAQLQQRYQSLGFPLNPEIQPPAAGNPAAALLTATSLARLTSAEVNLLYDDDPTGNEIRWTAPHKVQMRALLTRLQPAFDELDTAAPLKQEPLFSDPNLRLRPIRDLANALRADAILLHEDHQDAHALHRINQILAISRTMEGDHNLIGHLVAIGIRAMAAETVERLQPDLQLSPSDASIPEARTAVQTLTNFAPFQQQAIAALHGETVQFPHYHDEPSLDAWWIRPFLKSEMVLDGRLNDQFADILATQNNWPAVHAAMVTKFPDHDHGKMLEEFPFDYTGDPNSRFALMHFRCLSDSSAAAMLLAAELFKQNRAHYPDAAVDMVPDFLPKIPPDPFDASAKPMRYRLDPAGPTVWSVGENGTDEHAAIRFNVAEKARRYGDSPSNQPDIVYGAAWRTAAPPPAPTKITPPK